MLFAYHWFGIGALSTAALCYEIRTLFALLQP